MRLDLCWLKRRHDFRDGLELRGEWRHLAREWRVLCDANRHGEPLFLYCNLSIDTNIGNYRLRERAMMIQIQALLIILALFVAPLRRTSVPTYISSGTFTNSATTCTPGM